MMAYHARFVQAVQDKKKVWVKFYSQADGGVVEQVCAPLEYGAGTAVPDGLNRYWVWVYASQTDSHTVGLLPQEIEDLTVLGEVFDPAQFAPRPGVVSKSDGTSPVPVQLPAGVKSEKT